MKTINLLFILILFNITLAYSQKDVRITIIDDQEEALLGANILNKRNAEVAISDEHGIAKITNLKQGDSLQFSFIGFITQNIAYDGKSTKINIKLEQNLELEEVEISGSSTYYDSMESIFTEVITSGELKKAACCDLSESFETNVAVDVSKSDAATGAKEIRFLGLSGRYVQMQLENIPFIRGLNYKYGLKQIPGTWVESIDVNKGAGSIENSYEAMTGQINVRLRQAENTDKLYLNFYGNSFGRLEMNIHTGHKLNKKWSSSLLAYGGLMTNELDGNDDGFMDIPKTKQFNVLNRWKYQGDNMVGNWNFQVLNEERNGGQIGFDEKEDYKTSKLYGIQSKTRKFDFFGKNGFKEISGNPHHQLAFLYAINYTDLEEFYGRRAYSGKQLSAFVNGFFLTEFSDDKYKLKTGININYDTFDEELERLNADTYNWDRKEAVYGTYFELTSQLSEKISAITSARFDHNSIYGNQFTPRLHLKFSWTPSTTIRTNIGKGVRTPNVIIENSRFLVSNREVLVDFDNLKQEVSWNMGASLQKEFELFDLPFTLVTDYYYTIFENKVVTDIDSKPDAVIFNNLDGEAFAHSFQTEISFRPVRGLDLKTAYKFYQVKNTIDDKLREMPFVSKNRFFLNLGYEFPNEKFRIDWTGQYFGQQRLPDSAKSTTNQADEYSPTYFLMNTQLSYTAYEGLEFYIGGENIGNYTQENPIIGADDPFGKNFDASMNWGPVTGTMLYAGLRWKILE